jgi:hypothetical protein
MKKAVSYTIDIAVTGDGEIMEAQCECAAGMGPKGHCKHICATFYALFDFCNTGKVILQETCTEKLQTFHKCKKWLASPMKIGAILEKQLAASSESSDQPMAYDPRPEQFRNMTNYNTYVRNLTLNYIYGNNLSHQWDMPITHLFAPANPYGLENDHQYWSDTQSDKWLSDMHITAITSSEIEDIEKRTRGQASNQEWKNERLLRIHSSNFGKICKSTERRDLDKLAYSLMTASNLDGIAAIEHGRRYETQAVAKYAEETGCNVTQCGTFVSLSHPFLAASPDGVVNENLLLEVKCPYSARKRIITNVTVPYLVKSSNSDVYELNHNHDYYYQVQGQLFATGRTACDFFVYTTNDYKVIRIEKDDDFVRDMLQKLTAFFHNHFKPALKKQFFYKDYYHYFS